MSTPRMTLQEITESMTGFDEIALEKVLGQDVTSAQDHPTRLVRALIALDISREEGVPFGTAYERSMSMTLRDAMAYFSSDEEPMPEDPVTESGEDVSAA